MRSSRWLRDRNAPAFRLTRSSDFGFVSGDLCLVRVPSFSGELGSSFHIPALNKGVAEALLATKDPSVAKRLVSPFWSQDLHLSFLLLTVRHLF